MDDRQQLERLWLGRLKDAELRLQFARKHLNDVRKNLGAVEIPAADGNFAFQDALRTENFALAEYHRVLVIFTDLVLGRRIPDVPPKLDGSE